MKSADDLSSSVRQALELHWPAMLVGSACAGLTLSIWISVPLSVTAVVAFAAAGSAAHAADLTTQDYIEIEQLYATYNHAIDSGDAEAWAATFTPDGSFNTRFTGKEGLVGFIKMWREKMDGANRRH